MKHIHKPSALLLGAVALLCSCAEDSRTGSLALSPVDFSKVRIESSFWSPVLERHKEATIPVCIDQMESKTGRIRNYDKAAAGKGPHEGIYFDDSDVYKALEGMAYSLVNNPDAELEAKCDDWISRIAAAQQSDGYISTYYTIGEPGKRWTDLTRHEMYCAGHLLEAGVAYFQATGKRSLLDVGQRMADHMMSVFGPGKRHWIPGHQEIELALVKLYRVTGERKYLDFAHWLIGERGQDMSVFDSIRFNKERGYCQSDVPATELRKITGHAVRAMYLYSGMADVQAHTGDGEYSEALDSLWTDVVMRNMYITGGIGQSAHNEGITEGYHLPNLTAYCETCASIGMVFWNWRMNQATGDAKYVDVLERAMYNGVLAGVSLTGDRFFYVNPLESEGGHHRKEWFGCACCPSNICRFIPSIGNYVYGTDAEGVFVNMYIGSEATFAFRGREITIKQETDYPWDGLSKLSLGLAKDMEATIRLRIPGWCGEHSIAVNGERVECAVERGYALLRRTWSDGDSIELSMNMPVEVVAADPRVKDDLGKRAVQRGPLVYCIEEVDNPGYESALLSARTEFATSFEEGLLEGVEKINATTDGEGLVFIPYYSWDNRTPGRMKVWVDYAE